MMRINDPQVGEALLCILRVYQLTSKQRATAEESHWLKN